MAGRPKYSYPPDDVLREMVTAEGYVAVAAKLGFEKSTLHGHLTRRGLPTAKGVAEAAGGTTYTLDNLPAGAEWTPEALLKRVGLNPEEWRITHVKARGGHWGNPEEPSSQIRLEVSVAPIKPAIKPPDLTDWTPLPKPKPRKRKEGEPQRAVIISDHHAPRHEKTFHRLFVNWLRDHKPDVIHVNGDLGDYPTVSTHRTVEEFKHDVNECIRGSLRILRDYRDACPDARIVYLRGNHEARVENYTNDNAPEVSVVAPGGGETVDGDTDERPWHDFRRLLYLDELHIEYIPDPWEQAKLPLSRRLTSRHGFSTSPSAGKVMLDKLSGSTIQGHDHRLALNLRTRHTGDEADPLEVRLAMSGGCACEIPGGLGYITGGEPDWQNGAVSVDLYDNGDFYCSPMIYVPGRLLTREGRYT